MPPPFQGLGQDDEDDEGGDRAKREDVQNEVGVRGILLWVGGRGGLGVGGGRRESCSVPAQCTSGRW